jgi:DNA end-binding protein Ku
MPQRSYWKGYLKLSLVTCPVQMMPATSEGGRIRFRTLNAKTLHPVTSRWVDEGTGKPVDPADQVKGYPRGEGDYVQLTEEELDSVALDSTRTIDIGTFVDEGSIPWIWQDRAHYLMPSDPVGEEAFAVIRAAMAATRKVGISRLVMGGRERAVMLVPRGAGIILWTLRFGDEVRAAEGLYPDAVKADAKLVSMVEKLLTDRVQDWSPDLVEDPVEARLDQMIAAKAKAAKPAKTPKEQAPAKPGNVISLMDALRASMERKPAGGGGKGKPKGGKG